MAIRCKMQLQSITAHAWSKNSKSLKFTVCYDTSIPEDQRFAKATPSAQLEMQIDNPAALEQLQLGEFYYVELTPAPKS